jgi:hypothetical protein
MNYRHERRLRTVAGLRLYRRNLRRTGHQLRLYVLLYDISCNCITLWAKSYALIDGSNQEIHSLEGDNFWRPCEAHYVQYWQVNNPCNPVSWGIRYSTVVSPLLAKSTVRCLCTASGRGASKTTTYSVAILCCG